jgi:hypothetical protein
MVWLLRALWPAQLGRAESGVVPLPRVNRSEEPYRSA